MKNPKILKFKDGEFEMEIPYFEDEETVWLSLNQIAELFERNRSSISRQINQIFKEENTEKQYAQNAHCNARYSQIPFSDKPVKHFNLDVILEVGKRIKSSRGMLIKALVEEQTKAAPFNHLSDKIIIYDDGINKYELNLSLKEETIWTNQAQIADIFDTTQQNVSLHINNILEDKELDDSVHKDSLYTAPDGKQYLVTFYNLDMILAVGYRVKTTKAIFLRRWVSEVFKQYLKDLYESKGPNCIICRNEILELQRDVKQLQLESRHEITYFPGDQLRGFIEIKRFLETAKEEIILVDNYIGHKYDDVLLGIKVKKTIITNIKNKKIETCDNYTVIKTNELHDRYVLVDDVCYKFGSSLEQVGEKLSSSGKITDTFLINSIKNLKNNVVQKEVKKHNNFKDD
ncbi:MAG: virulence RhuM family protein [Bacilli bacterium]|nr:virulence RhuM family protein [Bacilli bacterium]